MRPKVSAALIAVLALLAATALAAVEPAPGEDGAAGVQARSADALVDSIGVNTHLGWTIGPYDRFRRVESALKRLGVRYIRDGVSQGRPDLDAHFRALAADGIRLNAIVGDPLGRWGSARLGHQLSLIADQLGPSVVASLEAPNEFDNEGIRDWASILRNYQRRLWMGAKARPSLAKIPVLGPSLVHADSRRELGDISAWTSEGNMHPYPGGNPPDTDEHMESELGLAAENTGGESVQATETGYTNALRTPGGHLPASERAAGVYMPRVFLDGFRRGITRSFVYELVDIEPDPSHSDEAKAFGLLRNDFSPKPAYRALANLIAILADRGPSFATGRLAYALAGGSAETRQLLLQKRDGSFYLALWTATSVWDPERRNARRAPPVPITIRFQQPIAEASLFRPNRSRRAVRSFREPRSLTLPIGPRVTVLRVQPAGR